MIKYGISSGRVFLPALVVALTLLVPALLLLIPGPSHSAKKKAKPATPAVVITPPKSYRDPVWRKKAAKLKPAMLRLQSGCAAKFLPAEFRFLTTKETSVGGIGIWPNPVKVGSTNRYLGVFVRVQVPPPSTARAFWDDENGRMHVIFDAYGKDIVTMMNRELAGITDPQIEGAAMIFIYGKRPLTDPDFESDAEGLLIFIPRAPLTEFAELRLRVKNLFEQSDRLRVFKGSEELSNLRLKVLKP